MSCSSFIPPKAPLPADVQRRDLLTDGVEGRYDLTRGGELEIFARAACAVLQHRRIALGAVQVHEDGVDDDAVRLGVGAGVRHAGVNPARLVGAVAIPAVLGVETV